MEWVGGEGEEEKERGQKEGRLWVNRRGGESGGRGGWG